MNRKVPLKLKGKFYEMVVKPIMLYEVEYWIMKLAHKQKMIVIKIRILR